MAQVTGRVFITISGKRVSSKEGAKLMMGGFVRETVMADAGVMGFSEKPIAPGVECTIAHTADVSLAEFQAMTAASISFDTDTGRSYVLSGAWCANGMELEKGEVKLVFGALDCKEV
jgi:hypothetical protein